MGVRAKMRVVERKEVVSVSGGEVQQVNLRLQAVYDEGANSQWSKYTPSGQLELCITNPDAYRQLELGKAYFVDLIPTEG